MSRTPEFGSSRWLESICARAAVLLARPYARGRADEMLGRPDSALPRDDDGRTPVLPFDIDWKRRDLALSTAQKYGVVVILALGWRPARPSWFVPRDDWPEPKERDRTAADKQHAAALRERCARLAQLTEPAEAAVRHLGASLRMHPEQASAADSFYSQLLDGVEGDIGNLAPSLAADGTSLRWFGRQYVFSKGQQAASIRLLFEAWQAGHAGASQERIAEEVAAGAAEFRLSKAFRYHLAWSELVTQVAKGVYGLAVPPAYRQRDPKTPE